MGPPPLDGAARREALARAMVARRARADLKRDLKRGSVSLVEAIDRAASEDAVANMRVVDLLAALPRIGPVRADELMRTVGIARTRRLRGLGTRQRIALVAAIDR